MLSTCNRTEVYLFADDTPAAARLAVGAAGASCGGVERRRARAQSPTAARGDAAIAHLFRVAASLDSMVVGEAQILAQLKDAYQAACGEGCTSTVFNRLFRHALEVGKRVRTETAIGERPVSVSSAAVDLARQVLGKLERPRRARARRRRDQRAHGQASAGARRRRRGGRQPHAGHAPRSWPRRCGGRAVCFDELDAQLAAADIVISSTASPGFLVDRARLAEIMRQRAAAGPMFLIDIAVPRDLDPDIARLARLLPVRHRRPAAAWWPPTAASASARSPRPSASSTRSSRA